MTTDRPFPIRRGIGASVLRHEDPPLLTGQARYVADIHLDRQLAMVVVRSPVAHGILRGVDTTAARALAGVEGVFTAEDLVACLGDMPRIHPGCPSTRRCSLLAAAPGYWPGPVHGRATRGGIG